MKTAITGGIGSGKSYVVAHLKKMGIDVYDCDAAAKRLMRHSADIRRQLTDLIGQEAYHSDGSLNKRAVSTFLHLSEANHLKINAIVHPAVAADFIESGMQWMECAILFDSGFDRLVDRVVCVTAPTEVRLQRIMKRDGISREAAQQWIDVQMPQEEVAERSDYEIINDGESDIMQQLLPLLSENE